jgi:D-glycero-D-manno-heptose 1,7-bisphosphate phosphatase
MRAVFLDRDGVLNECRVIDGKPFPPESTKTFRVVPQAFEACRKLKEAGFTLVVVTNQPDVGRGTQTFEEVDAMHEILRATLPIDVIKVCTHGHDGECECRKPKPGMLFDSAKELTIDLSKSYMVGDRWKDIDCGHACGCTTLFIDYEYTGERLRQQPDAIVRDIGEAADWIIRHSIA